MPTDNVLPDIPRLYTAFSEWMACLIIILNSGKRFKIPQTIGLNVLFLAAFVGFHLMADILPIGFWIPCMIFAVFMMCGYIWLTTKSGIKLACYLGVQAFITAEFVSAFEWWLYYYFSRNFPAFGTRTASILFALGIYAAAFCLIFFVERRFSLKNISAVSSKELVTAVIIALTAFLVSNISFVNWDTPLSGKYALEISYIRALVDLCGLLVLYSNREMKIANSASEELTQIRLLLDKQYEQYCFTKSTMDAVNRRYHDLKHQVALIHGRGEGAGQLVDEIEKETKLYEAVYNTGNNILDTILMSKSVMCVRDGITVTCVADGAALDFIGDADLCSLFGNALDNAIESFKGKDGEEAKLIKLTVYKNNGLLIIRCSNTFNGKLKTLNGELITTKPDKPNHGYGVKSIKTVAEKYGGTVTYNVNDGMFTLCVVIPVSV